MKKTAICVMTALLSFAFVPEKLNAAEAMGQPVQTEIMNINDSKTSSPGEIVITPEDLKNLDESKKQEVEKAIAEQQARHGGGVVVISGTALLLIILLIILL